MRQSVEPSVRPPHHRRRPAEDPAGRAPYRRRHWLAAAGLGAALGAVAHGLMVRDHGCHGLGCTGTGPTGAAAGMLLVPLLAVLGLAALRVPAATTVAVAGLLVGLASGTAVAMLDAAVHGLHPGDRPVPLWLLVPAGALSGPAGIMLGGRGFERAQRVGVLLGAGVVVALASMPLSGR